MAEPDASHCCGEMRTTESPTQVSVSYTTAIVLVYPLTSYKQHLRLLLHGPCVLSFILFVHDVDRFGDIAQYEVAMTIIRLKYR